MIHGLRIVVAGHLVAEACANEAVRHERLAESYDLEIERVKDVEPPIHSYRIARDEHMAEAAELTIYARRIDRHEMFALSHSELKRLRLIEGYLFAEGE